MSYAVEAVHWTPGHEVEFVRWHEFNYVDGELRKGPSVVCAIATVAVAAARGHDLYLCYHGAVGRKIDVVELPGGRKTLIDLPSGDQAQVLADLPKI